MTEGKFRTTCEPTFPVWLAEPWMCMICGGDVPPMTNCTKPECVKVQRKR